MSLTSLAKFFGILLLSIQLSVALPQASTCSCNGNISSKGSGECKTEHEKKAFCYVQQGQCPDEQESSTSGWFWSYRACAKGTKSNLQETALFSKASTCSCNGKISSKGSGECKTNHEEKAFCYVNQGQCPDEQESSTSGWFWSKQACAPRTRSPVQGPNLRSRASTCSCNGNISSKGSGECKTNHEEKAFCYVQQGQCPDEQESSTSGWFWSKQACAPRTRSPVQGTSLQSKGGLKYLTSPNFPNAYSNNQDTTQIMSVPVGSSIQVKFIDFQVEKHQDCRWDYVEICDGIGKCHKKICGSSLPGEIIIDTSTAKVKFHSDGSVTQKGFKLSYQAIEGSLKFLTSPNYPDSYSNNQHTVSTLSVPDGSSMQVKFLDFQIENHASCRWDYVQICDGNRKCQEKMCGSSFKDITIETSRATVKFHSDGSVTQKGFKLSYQALTAKPTGGVLLHKDKSYEYYKVPVPESSKMLSTTVLSTCTKHGMKPQCFGNGGNLDDSNCVSAPDGSLPLNGQGKFPREMAKILCQNTNIKSCAAILNTFWYMANNWGSGSACGALKADYCSQGKDYISTSKLQYYAACIKTL